jgi:DNA-binding LacI/PurR family transcriptional regulator
MMRSPRKIDSNSPNSIRSQLRVILQKEISEGVYKNGQRFPSERSLAERFGVSRASVRETIAQLISDEVLFRTVGRGTYVTEPSSVLRTGVASRQIGFLISEEIFHFVETGYKQILTGIAEYCRQMGFTLVFHSVGDEEGYSQSDSAKRGNGSDLDGYLVVGGIQRRLLERLKQQGKPIILVDLLITNGGAPSVAIDYASGIRQAVEHLFALGHKDLGFIGFAESAKYESFWSSLESLGLTYHPRLVQFLNPTDLQPSIMAGYKAMQKMLATPGGLPSALIATNDLVALGAMEALSIGGIPVPGGLSIVGCDDLGQNTDPPLTTLRVDWVGFGKLATQFLLEKLDRGITVEDKHMVFPVELVVRASTSAPNRGLVV